MGRKYLCGICHKCKNTADKSLSRARDMYKYMGRDAKMQTFFVDKNDFTRVALHIGI